MEAAYQHNVLVVDDDPEIAGAIARLLEAEQITVVLADSSESALKCIHRATKPFSLILSDQRSDGMPGTEFLEKAKKITPDSQRFLLTAYSNIGVIINAVNKGSIQRYISKPWDDKFLITAIRSGLMNFEHSIENEKLLMLAKKQNSKLYELNCELMESTTHYSKEHQVFEKKIRQLETLTENLTKKDLITIETVLDGIKDTTIKSNDVDNEKMTQLLIKTIQTLYKQFNEVAIRNGFEMPLPKGDITC